MTDHNHDHDAEMARYGICLTCTDAGRLTEATRPAPAEQMALSDGLTFDGPGLATHDHARLSTQTQAVLDLIADGYWRTLSEISEHTDAPEASVSARLRDLRKPRFGGHTIERRLRDPNTPGRYEYRLTRPPG